MESVHFGQQISGFVGDAQVSLESLPFILSLRAEKDVALGSLAEAAVEPDPIDPNGEVGPAVVEHERFGGRSDYLKAGVEQRGMHRGYRRQAVPKPDRAARSPAAAP